MARQVSHGGKENEEEASFVKSLHTDIVETII